MTIKLSATRLDMGKARLDNAIRKDWVQSLNALGNVSGATSIDLSLGNIITATATAAVTWSVTNVPSTTSTSTSFTLILTNGGRFTQTWMGSTTWRNGNTPTLSAVSTDIITFFTNNNGTSWRGAVTMSGTSTGGRLFAWGYNGFGEIGFNVSGGNWSSPVQISGNLSIITVSGLHPVPLRPDSSLWHWGKTDYGQVGNVDTA